MEDHEKRITGAYEFVVTNIDENHTATATYSTIEQVLYRVNNDLSNCCCHNLLNTIQIQIRRK